jgi:hypothetical protein
VRTPFTMFGAPPRRDDSNLGIIAQRAAAHPREGGDDRHHRVEALLQR